MEEARPVLSDGDMILGCLAGRKDHWDAFVERFSKLIYWSIHQTLDRAGFARHTDLAGEIFQDVFRKILERQELERLRDAKSVRKFLAVLSGHLASDRLKSLSRAKKRNLPEEAGEGFESAHPSTAVLLDERDQIIASVLEDLEPEERACVQYHYVDGKTQREIARILGFPEGTVATIIRRTKDKLKTKFLEKGITD